MDIIGFYNAVSKGDLEKIKDADKLHEERLLIKKNRRGSAPPSCKVCGYYAKCQIRIDLYGNDDTYSESEGEQE